MTSPPGTRELDVKYETCEALEFFLDHVGEYDILLAVGRDTV